MTRLWRQPNTCAAAAPRVLALAVRSLPRSCSDAEIGYRSRAEIGENLERDPLVHAARLLAEAGIAEPGELLARHDAVAADVRRLADDAPINGGCRAHQRMGRSLDGGRKRSPRT